MIARKHLLSLMLLIIAFPCVAQDGVVTIEGTRIRGDQEVPTVLYLVPAVQSLARPDEQLMLQRPIAPLERQEFQRLVSYHQYFRASVEDGKASGATDATSE